MENEVKPLEEWRISRFLSQGKLAKKAGISKGVISRLESGDRHGCWLETAQKIASALEVDASQVAEFIPVIRGKPEPLTHFEVQRLSTSTGVSAPVLGLAAVS